MRFNLFPTKNIPVRNYKAALAYPLWPALELYAAVVALSDQSYEAADLRLARLRALVARLAVFMPASTGARCRWCWR